MSNDVASVPVTTLPYRTKDLNEAAFVWCQPKATLVAVEAEGRDGAVNPKEKPDTFYFKFELACTEKELKELIFGFANEQKLVEPQMFVRKQNNLRDRLYAVKRRFGLR